MFIFVPFKAHDQFWLLFSIMFFEWLENLFVVELWSGLLFVVIIHSRSQQQRGLFTIEGLVFCFDTAHYSCKHFSVQFVKFEHAHILVNNP